MYIVYTLLSIESSYRYVGFTENPINRLEKHNRGEVKSTRPFKPYGMVLIKKVSCRTEARKLEKYYKSGFGRKALNNLIERENISTRLREKEIIDLSQT